MINMMDMTVSALLKDQVCILVILVIQFYAPLITLSIFVISYMFQVLQKVYYLFTDLLLIIMFSLSSILSSF
jgi:hypothetical protein